eukprot:m.157726 g.157726  ORF g.157726 m.157726 type:complete len:60 (-) comp16314_c2_seq5:148-327(-)
MLSEAKLYKRGIGLLVWLLLFFFLSRSKTEPGKTFQFLLFADDAAAYQNRKQNNASSSA